MMAVRESIRCVVCGAIFATRGAYEQHINQSAATTIDGREKCKDRFMMLMEAMHRAPDGRWYTSRQEYFR